MNIDFNNEESYGKRGGGGCRGVRVSCPACGKLLASKWGLEAHIKSVHGQRDLQCEFCEKAFARRDHLVNHTRSMHTGSKKCSQCGEQCVGGKEAMAIHIRAFHPSLAIQCEICLKDFTSKMNLRQHIEQTHTSITCDECEESFIGKISLQKHNDLVHRVFVPMPVLPKKVSASKSSKMEKFNDHKEIKCLYCASIFERHDVLQEHIRSVHTQSKCLVCGLCFVTSEVQNHARFAHPPNKVIFDNEADICFQCPYMSCCSQSNSFRQKSEFDQHFMAAHVYTTYDHLHYHQRPMSNGHANITENKVRDKSSPLSISLQEGILETSSSTSSSSQSPPPYRCEFCHLFFAQSGQLSAHISLNHTFGMVCTTLPLFNPPQPETKELIEEDPHPLSLFPEGLGMDVLLSGSADDAVSLDAASSLASTWNSPQLYYDNATYLRPRSFVPLKSAPEFENQPMTTLMALDH